MLLAPRTVVHVAEASPLRLLDVVYPADTDFDTHVHEEEYACVVLGGRYQEWAGVRRGVEAGTYQVWEAGSKHAVRTGGRPVRIVHVADPAASGRLVDHALSPGILLQLSRSVALEGDPDDATRLHLESLLLELLERPEGASGPQPSPLAEEPWMRTVRARLREAPAEAVRLDELARLAGRHPSHLTRAFRERWGMTPGEYLRRIRVAVAVRLLRDTEGSLATVAASAGFADQSHLGRWMRRYVAATPRQVRARARATGTPDPLTAR